MSYCSGKLEGTLTSHRFEKCVYLVFSHLPNPDLGFFSITLLLFASAWLSYFVHSLFVDFFFFVPGIRCLFLVLFSFVSMMVCAKSPLVKGHLDLL